MATYYLDYDGGNDANDGTTFANRWKTWTSGATAARIAPGDTIRVMKSKDPTSLGINGTWTDAPSAGPFATSSITSSTNASPISVTTGTHGLSTGDYVWITGHTTNTNANGHWKITVTSSTTFTLDGSTGNGTGGATGTYQIVTNGVVTLASALTKTIASTGNQGEGRTAWTASANVTTSLSTSMLRSGDVTDSIAVQAAFTTGLAAYKALGSAVDFSAYKQVSFNIMQIAGTAASASGDISIKLCSDTAGATPVNTINVPGLAINNTMNTFTVDTGAALGSSIQSVALYVNTDRGTQTFIIDNIIACKDSTSNDSLTLSSLIGKNSGNETWYGIASIKDTQVILDNGRNTNTVLGFHAGYSGTTETVTTYKREPTITLGNANATVSSVTDSGTAGSYINFEGGWDRTNMTTQDGETWYASQNASGTGLLISGKSFISINKINMVGYSTGLQVSTASHHIIIDNYSGNCNNNNGILMTSSIPSNILFKTINALNNNVGAALSISGSASVTINTLNSISNNTATSSTNAALTILTSNSVVIRNLGNVTNNRYYGVSGFGLTSYNGTFSKNYTAVCTANAVSQNAYIYFRNTTMSGTEFDTSGTANGLYIYSEKHDKTTDNHYIFGNYGVITSDTSVRHTASGISWKMSPTSTSADSIFPLKLSIAKIACTSGNLVTVKAWMRRDDTGLTMSLVCPGNQISGVSSDVTSSMTAAANTWEELTITFTPSEAGTVEIFAYAYGGSTFNGYVDDMTITQA